MHYSIVAQSYRFYPIFFTPKTHLFPTKYARFRRFSSLTGIAAFQRKNWVGAPGIDNFITSTKSKLFNHGT
jgi:hypothetical protein